MLPRSFWRKVDDWSHHQTWIPKFIQEWICDRYDATIIYNKRSYVSRVLARSILKEDDHA